MATIKDNARHKIEGNIYLVMGATYKFKVEGLCSHVKPNKHIILKSQNSNVVTVVSEKPDDKNLDQTFKIQAIAKGATKLISQEPNTNEQKKCNDLSGELNVIVDEKITLPTQDPIKAITYLLMAEAAGVGSQNASLADVKKSMLLMCEVLINRRDLISPEIIKIAFAAETKSILGVIKGKGQFAGFNDYPNLSSHVTTVIDGKLSIANSGSLVANTHRNKFTNTRTIIQYAIELATKLSANILTVDKSRAIYSWRTANASSPGSNFVFYQTIAGQDFYSLKPTYIEELKVIDKNLKNKTRK